MFSSRMDVATPPLLRLTARTGMSWASSEPPLAPSHAVLRPAAFALSRLAPPITTCGLASTPARVLLPGLRRPALVPRDGNLRRPGPHLEPLVPRAVLVNPIIDGITRGALVRVWVGFDRLVLAAGIPLFLADGVDGGGFHGT